MTTLQNTKKFRAKGRMMATALIVSAVVGPACVTQAIENLSSGNSTMTIDPMSATGVNSWTVEGQNQLFSQWFYYRVGAVGPEMSIDTLGSPTVSTVGNQSTILFSGSQFDLGITYTLTGGSAGSGLSDLSEDISILNTSGGALDIHFYQYSDFNLEGTAGGDSVLLYPGLSPFSLAYQWENTTGLSESIANNNPYADRGEVGFTPSILTGLNDGVATDLNNGPGPVGAGDVSFAFQWDFLGVADGDTKTISKLKNLNINVVPEPTTASLGLLGLAFLAARRMRKNGR